MKTKLHIRSVLGILLFEHEAEDNSILKTLKEALKRGVDLRGSDLRGLDLTGVDFRGSDLRGVDLRGSDLRGVDLRGVDLRGVDLRGLDLTGVDLTGADLTGLDLTGVDFRGAKNKELAYMPQFCKWTHSINGNKIQLGCKEKTVEEWQLFFESNEEYSTKRGTKEFKQIQAIFESYKAYLNHLAS
jgi:hypothetical protein